MSFSVKNNPYVPMFPHVPQTDPSIVQKALALRQCLNARLQVPPNFDFLSTLLAACSSGKFPLQDSPLPPSSPAQKNPCPAINPLFSCPTWFNQAFASTLSTGSIPLPRQLPEDLSLPMISPRSSDVSPVTSTKLCKRPLQPSPIHPKYKPSTCDPSLRTAEKDHTDPLHPKQSNYPLLFREHIEKHSKQSSSSSSSNMENNPRISRSTAPQHETGTLVPSLIDGEIIMGFNVWGEKRLCLPHLFRFVLNDVDLKAIDEACTQLQITCTTCSPAQLTLLHSRKILPQAVSSCGLIRKSDAERLTKFIRNRLEADSQQTAVVNNHRSPQRPSSAYHKPSDASGDSVESFEQTCEKSEKSIAEDDSVCEDLDSHETTPNAPTSDEQRRTEKLTQHDDQSLSNSIPVLHECFGRQLGLIHSDLYTEATAKCIECGTCHRLFAPDQFVGHTHTITEVDHLNHWGFDSGNWRCYLRLYCGHKRLRPSVGSPTAHQQHRRNSVDLADLDDDTEEEDEARTADSQDLTSGLHAQLYRRLEEFKIKFAQPIRLPASLSAALRTVGLCASVAPIASAMARLETNESNNQPKKPQSSTLSYPPTLPTNADSSSPKSIPHTVPHTLTVTPTFSPFTTSSSSSSCCSSSTSSSSASSTPAPNQTTTISPPVILPQLTLRRLWAPNDGRIKIPPPPRRISVREKEILPKKLHTGPPLLLHSHRVVSRSTAEYYDRDFIPNVCLMPLLKTKPFRQSRLAVKRNWNGKIQRPMSSGSRSRSTSRDSINSGSSRTRSISVSSTSSSSCSYDQLKKRRNETSPTGQHSPNPIRRTNMDSAANLTLEPRPRSLSPSRLAHWPYRRSSSTVSDSAVRLYARQLDESKRRRCRSLTVSSFPVGRNQLTIIKSTHRRHSSFGDLYPKVHRRSLLPQAVSREKRISLPSIGHHKKSDQLKYHSSDETDGGQQRAMAAAKAAQGAASSIGPGLWTRHFTKFNGSRSGPMTLPNARNPSQINGRVSTGTNGRVTSNTPVLVTSASRNSLPTAVLALESIWADLVRQVNEYTVAVESHNGVQDARQRLFDQFISMQTCYATHIASLMNENQKLQEKLSHLEKQSSHDMRINLIGHPNSPVRPVAPRHPEGDFGAAVPCNGNQITAQLETQTVRAPEHGVYPHRNRRECFMYESKSNPPNYVNKPPCPSRPIQATELRFHPAQNETSSEKSHAHLTLPDHSESRTVPGEKQHSTNRAGDNPHTSDLIDSTQTNNVHHSAELITGTDSPTPSLAIEKSQRRFSVDPTKLSNHWNKLSGDLSPHSLPPKRRALLSPFCAAISDEQSKANGQQTSLLS